MTTAGPRLWVLGAAISAVGFAGMVILDLAAGTLRAEHTPTTIGLYAIAFVGFMIAAIGNERVSVPKAALWLIPIAFRLLMLLTAPTLSDDVYRYLWDGHLITEGVNPYAHKLDDPALDEYEIDARRLANNPSTGTEYLPAAQLTFAASAAVLPSDPWSLRLVMIGFDLAAAASLVVLLRRAHIPDRRVLLYLWNPLVIVEVAHGAHLDGLMIGLALLSVALALGESSSQRWASPVVLALATLTRPLPLLLCPVLWWRYTWAQRVLFPLTMLAFLFPFGVGGNWHLIGETDGTGLFGATRVFVRDVTFNGGPHRWLATALDRSGADDSDGVARIILGAVLFGLIAWVWWRARTVGSDRRLLRLAVVPVAAFLAFSSIVHPWYAVGLMALVPLLSPGEDESDRRWWLLAPWMYLAATLVLSYLTYLDPDRFAELVWVRRVEWYPVTALLLVAVTQRE